ncbi:MAG: GntR family transcriptional regulator [Desulfomicrobium apsheronum]|nr:GntR family transcriptional regulator [Desulfomicrobium apsheronum]
MASTQRPILCQKVADMLKGTSFSVGDRLPGERRLAEMFDTSRNTIREVLCNLETMGYVEIRQKSGCYLKSKDGRISWNQLRRRKSQIATRQILDTLTLVIPTLAREQASRLTTSDVVTLESATARLGEAIVNFDSTVFTRAYIAFFLALAKISANDYLILLMKELQAAAHNLEHAGTGLAEVQTGFLFEYHVELFNALKSSRADEAEKLALQCMHTFASIVLPGE